MTLNLKRTENDINRIEREGINNNWTKIEDNFNNVVKVIGEKAFEEVVDSAKLIWQQPVATFADLNTTYPNAEIGWAAWAKEVVNGVSRAYRYNGSQWLLQQEFVGDAINEVNNRLTEKIRNVVVDITDFGAIANNSNIDNTSIIQTAYNTLKTGDTFLIPSGDYYISNLIFDKDDVTINSNGRLIQFAASTGTAVKFAKTNADIFRVNGRINVLKQGGRNWSQDNTGVEFLNANEFNYEIIARDFTNNVFLKGDDFKGTAYNIFNLKRVVNGKYNLRFSATNNGWVNENQFIGGRLAWFNDVTDNEKWQVYMPGQTMNNNTFVGMSLEGINNGTLIYCNGNHNTFNSVRLESDISILAIHFGPNSIYNQVIYPYLGRDITNASVARDEGSRNHILDRDIYSLSRTQMRVDNIRMRGALQGNTSWDVEGLIDVSSRVSSNDQLLLGRNVVNQKTSSLNGNGIFKAMSVTVADDNLQSDIFGFMRNGSEGVLVGRGKVHPTYQMINFAPFSLSTTGVKPTAVIQPGAAVLDTVSKRLYVSIGTGQYITFKSEEATT